ncbi:hypothetical protein HZB60_00320 [candidate division KSB1 bacterium]|nr:hypothetical protein [candidate division KSB1 bacterium]
MHRSKEVPGLQIPPEQCYIRQESTNITDKLLMEDIEDIYSELGKYVVCFQHLESKILQIAWFLDDPAHAHNSGTRYVSMRFHELIKIIESNLVRYAEKIQLDGIEQFSVDIGSVTKQCQEAGRNRNRLVHSHYLHLEAGGHVETIIRSYSGKGVVDSRPQIFCDNEELRLGSFANAIFEIAGLSFILGLLHNQLIGWHGNTKPIYSGFLLADTRLRYVEH